MLTSYTPPGVNSLADIDPSKVGYEKKCAVIDGVVSPGSQGVVTGSKDGYSLHCFKFAAWQRVDEPVIRRELTVIRAVPLDATSYDNPSYSIQRISALLSTDATRAVFEKSLPLESRNAELEQIADELQLDVVIPTERFGELLLDRRLGVFEGEAEWNGEWVPVMFPSVGNAVYQEDLDTAEALWSEEATWIKRIEDFAAKKMLELKNGPWRGEDEPILTAEEFIQRMALSSI